MPQVYIPRIGNVDFIYKDLPEGIKGKSIIGDYSAPIIINETLTPGTKQDYVVAHEVGHRLTLDMVINADKERPDIFNKAPYPSAALVRYLITLGLKESDLKPLHPKTKEFLHRIFEENARGDWTEDYLAREFIAEVYANWATDSGHIPPAISERFSALTKTKNAILITKGLMNREEIDMAAFSTETSQFGNPFDLTPDQKQALAVFGLVAIGFLALKGLF